MAMKGMNVQGGTEAAQRFMEGSEEIEELTARYTTVLESFEWYGPDADRTRQTWNEDYRRMLGQVSTAMQTFATLLNNQAREQEQVSA